MKTAGAILLILTTGSTFAALGTVPQTELAQQQIRQSAQAVAAQIGELLNEFERNHLAGADRDMLRAIHTVLNRLSVEQMQRVVDLLRQNQLLDAYATQKNILIQLRQILIEHQRHQTLRELADRFNELSIRQNNNLTETTALAQWSSNENQQVSLDLQLTEQRSLHEETKPTLLKLSALVPAVDAWSTHAGRQAVQYAQKQQLLPTLAAAVTNLQDGKFAAAAVNEEQARDILRQLARLLTPLDKPSAIRQAIHDATQIEEQQRQLIEQTSKTGYSSVAAPELARQQSRLADWTAQLRQDLDTIAPVPAAALDDAARHLQTARPSILKRDKPAALVQQQAGLDKLTIAREQLQKQLAAPEPPPRLPAETVARLKQLQQQTDQLAADQARLEQAATSAHGNRQALGPLATAQNALSERTEALTIEVAATAPSAAAPLSQAADDMADAGRAFAKNEPATATVAQSSAKTALAKASQELTLATNNAEQDQRTLETGVSQQNELTKLIEAQQQTKLQTAMSPSRDLAGRQGQLAQQSQQLRQRLAPVSTAAATAAGQASGHMNNAEQSLSRNDVAGAQRAQQAALDELFAAKDALDERFAELQPSATAPAETASALAQTQESVTRATHQLRYGDQQAAQTLRQAAAQAGQLTTRVPAFARAGLQAAQSALATATAQAAASNLSGAMNSVNTAQQALAQAQASLALRNATPTGNRSTTATAGSATEPGDDRLPATAASGQGQFIGLPPRDREVIQQSQSEKYPSEYGSLIEQYWRNLAEESERR